MGSFRAIQWINNPKATAFERAVVKQIKVLICFLWHVTACDYCTDKRSINLTEILE